MEKQAQMKYILWGAGKTADYILNRLKVNSVDFPILYFVDNNPEAAGTEKSGYKIYPPAHLLKASGPLHIVVCSLTDGMTHEVEAQLRGMGIGVPFHVYSIQHAITPYIFAETGKLELLVCGIIFTTHCTMRCKRCSTMVPFIKNKRHVMPDEMKQWLDGYFKLTDHVRIINIFGGEPLIHPKLDKIIELLACYHDKFDELVLTTNATVLPTEQVLEKCRKYHILFQISDYGNMDPQFVGCLEKAGIGYLIRPIDSWYALYTHDKEGNADAAAETCHKCDYSAYHAQLYDNRVFACPIVTGLYVSDRTEHYCEEDVFHLAGTGGKQEFLRFLNGGYSRGYISSCEKCYGTDSAHTVPIAEQI